jgi:hypothetical protein
MPFMERQITAKIAWYKGEAFDGATYYSPAADLTEFAFARDVLGNIYGRVEIITGYGARLSAPGYLDCTDWAVFDSRAAAEVYLDELTDGDEAEGQEA